jgi:3-deoxy-manno-octulosonate cytidylyltransferase (CMP-KDO synthetase)
MSNAPKIELRSPLIKTTIIIPARWGSTRLPGKPLALIAGRTMLSRVVAIAKAAAQNDPQISLLVATDDSRIMAHCEELNVPAVMTSVDCLTGTDRAQAAVKQLSDPPDFIVNLQGDALLTPPDFITALIDHFRRTPTDVVTPVTQLDWEALDRLRHTKSQTPFSGTLAAFDAKTGRAFWFSKTIFPALRKEAELRATSSPAPVWRHVGIYGFSRAMLATYVTLPEGFYEKLEGLEQLRVLEHGYEIGCVPVDYRGRASMSGVDSPEDIARAEALIAKHGELIP